MGFLLLPRIGEFTVFGESLQNYQQLNDSKQKNLKIHRRGFSSQPLGPRNVMKDPDFFWNRVETGEIWQRAVPHVLGRAASPGLIGKQRFRLGITSYKWVFPKIGVPQNGWFMMENPIKMDDLGVALFLETPKWNNSSGVWTQSVPSTNFGGSFGWSTTK